MKEPEIIAADRIAASGDCPQGDRAETIASVRFMKPSFGETLGTVFFGIAVLHVFSVKILQRISHRFRAGSLGQKFFHLIGEVELVFGVWAITLMATLIALEGWSEGIRSVSHVSFNEPVFVFAIMMVSATRPILELAHRVIERAGRVLPFRENVSYYISALTLGPLLGSPITEPAAVTVTALLLRDRYFKQGSERFKYLTLGVLFVSVSMGGLLTSFAAPPVLMVAKKWNWNSDFMLLRNFGWKAIIANLLSLMWVVALNYRELTRVSRPVSSKDSAKSFPLWVSAVHLVCLGLMVMTVEQPLFYLAILFGLIAFTQFTQRFQQPLKIKSSLMVGFFLAGLVVLGEFQTWWIEPVIRGFQPFPLFLGSAALTSVLDNALITYLGAQIPELGENFRYALVAGAVAGGGLTVIANAPNPAGLNILGGQFGPDGVSPSRLFAAALIPTLIAMGCLWVL